MSWKKLCKADELADKALRRFEVEGVPMVVVRAGDEFFAYPPLCPHQEEQLEVSGVCDGELLTCTKHLWQWDIRTGAERGMAERPLLMYPVKREEGDLWVFVEAELQYEYDDEED